MGSSPGFASIPIDQLRPVQTRFPYGSGPEDLSQANDDNSPDHYSIGTPSPLRAPTACRHTVSGSFPPLAGFFSSFARATYSLSVAREYLALGDGPPRFGPGFTCPDLLGYRTEVQNLSSTGLSPTLVRRSNRVPLDFGFITSLCRPHDPKFRRTWFRLDPVSLATTQGVEFSFSSCGYLDVSVPHVRRTQLWIHCALIRVFRDQRLFDGSPRLFAAFHALHRLLAPRHPPCALSCLISSALPPSPWPLAAFAARCQASGDKTHDQHAAFISDSYLSSLHFRHCTAPRVTQLLPASLHEALAVHQLDATLASTMFPKIRQLNALRPTGPRLRSSRHDMTFATLEPPPDNLRRQKGRAV